MRKKRALIIVCFFIAALVTTWLVLASNCPSFGIAITANARRLHRLKNRTTAPQQSDFDSRVTLDALLQSGDDRNRWSTERAARVQGQVIDVQYARPEATNCYSLCRRDIHVALAQRKEAPQNQQMIVEVTPNFRDWLQQQGTDTSVEALQRSLIGHWCEFEGWLYFDAGHLDQSENTAANNSTNWRATAWEIHPVTKISCESSSKQSAVSSKQ